MSTNKVEKIPATTDTAYAIKLTSKIIRHAACDIVADVLVQARIKSSEVGFDAIGFIHTELCKELMNMRTPMLESDPNDIMDDSDAELEMMAQRIIEMEDAHDSSMETVYLDQMVSSYVECKAEEIILNFTDLMDKQVETIAYYGDIDWTVEKLTDETKHYPGVIDKTVDEIMSKLTTGHVSGRKQGAKNVTTRTLFLKNNPSCAEVTQWYLTMQIEKPDVNEYIENGLTAEQAEEFVKRYTDIKFMILEETGTKKKSVNPRYWDLREDNAVVWLNWDRHKEKFVVTDCKGMLRQFGKFSLPYRTLGNAWFGLQQELKEKGQNFKS